MRHPDLSRRNASRRFRAARLAAAIALLFAAPLADRLVAQDIEERNAHDTHALTRWIGLPHDRQLLVLQSLGVGVPQDYFNCVCRAAAYGSSGTSQFYHPDTIGDYDKRYSCQHPGPPCVVSGYGCSRHPLPSDPKIFEGCARAEGLEGGNPLDNILSALRDRSNRTALSGNPVIMNADPAADPPPDCAKSRAEAGLAPPPALADVPRENMLYALSPEATARLGDLSLAPDVKARLLDALNEIAAQLHDMDEGFADERDLRVDFGRVEIGFSVNADRKIFISEIVAKTSTLKETGLGSLQGEGALTLVTTDPDDPAAIMGHKVAGVKLGFSFEAGGGGKAAEAKYGIDITNANKATDFYDGEWRSASENTLVRGIGDLVSKLDFYTGYAVGVSAPAQIGPDGKINVGVEYTWKLKDRYSNWLFSDMNAALDNMLDNQKDWEAKRHDYIAREARRFGIDARCFTTGQTIRLTHDAYARQQASDPGVAKPFQSITDQIAARRARAAEPAAPAAPREPPAAAPAPPPAEGIFQQQMLR